MLKVIADAARAAEELVAVSEAAIRAPGLSMADRLAMEEARPYALQAELNEKQQLVFASHAVSQPELEFAFAYYNSGPGRDRKIIDAAAAVRKMLGKHL